VERGTQGQGTRNGSLSFKNQVAAEGKISFDPPFTVEGPPFGTIHTTIRACTFSSSSVEEAEIDVSYLRQRVCESE
jgi:hypothetical protein